MGMASLDRPGKLGIDLALMGYPAEPTQQGNKLKDRYPTIRSECADSSVRRLLRLLPCHLSRYRPLARFALLSHRFVSHDSSRQNAATGEPNAAHWARATFQTANALFSFF